ncbi:MAG: YlxR family protein [Bacilli bacterium]|nr:YlxR family protein [Bacilli bacterium]
MKKPVLRFDCVNRIKVDKSSLLRIVKSPQGEILVDPTGKMNGRGAYLTPDRKTFILAKKNKSLEKTLKSSISDEVYRKIEKYLHE